MSEYRKGGRKKEEWKERGKNGGKEKEREGKNGEEGVHNNQLTHITIRCGCTCVAARIGSCISQ